MRNKKFIKILMITFVFLCASYFFRAHNFVFAADTTDRTSYGTVYSDNTSTNYSVKGGVGDPIVGRSKSSNYIIDHGLTMDLDVMTITIPTSVNFGVITPGVPSVVSSTVAVHMAGALDGYFLQVQRDDATSTLDLTTDDNYDFPDAAAWNPAGSGNAATSTGDDFSFRIMQSGTTSNYDSAWWGANDSIGIAKYAGFPAVSQQIMVCPTCNFGTTTSTIGYRAIAPILQKSGVYDGSITYTVLAHP